MKIVIVYHSILGSAKKYAHWLQEKTNADLFGIDQIGGQALDAYTHVVVMSGTYAGHMPLTKYLQDNWKCLEGKRVVAVAVGMLAPNSDQSKTAYELIPWEIRSKIKYFKLPGRFFFAGRENVKQEALDPVIKELNK